jgi:hypothetical protein
MQEDFEKVNQENNELKNQVSTKIHLIDSGKPNYDDALPKDRGKRIAHQQTRAVNPSLGPSTDHPTTDSSRQ